MNKVISVLAAALLILVVGCSANTDTGEQTDMSNQNQVVLETTEGRIVIELAEEPEVTTENFQTYVEDGFYDGTIFHRIVPGFVVQGGGFLENGTQKETRSPIRLETDTGLTNDAYTVAMARTSDPDSATSQFFINTEDNANLDAGPNNAGYAVFGEVVEGRDVVDAIEAKDTTRNGRMLNWPVKPVVIESATLQ